MDYYAGAVRATGDTRNATRVTREGGDRRMRLVMEQDSLDEAVVVRIEGAIDSSNAEELAGVLTAAVATASGHPARLLVIDLKGVSFFGSAGLNAVFDCHEKGAANAVAVRLVASQPEVVRPIEVTKLDAVLQLYPALADAVRPQSGP